jgi:cysteine desulfurase/selenocysteine lyase
MNISDPLDLFQGLDENVLKDILSACPRPPDNGPLAACPAVAVPGFDFGDSLRALEDLAAEERAPRGALDADAVRKDFPILSEKINGKPLIWLDNAATTQKPARVIERLKYYYEHENSNVHRAAHTLAARATDAYEGARAKIAAFIGAASPEEIVLVRGTTEAVNLVAQTYGAQTLTPGDEVLISLLEHHSNIVPWQMACEKTGARLKVIPVDDAGQIDMAAYAALLGPRVKLVAFTHVSNALGTVTPAPEMAAMAHAAGARVLMDGAQAVGHFPVDVRALDCDVYAFSGHKLFGPTGIGALYAKAEVLETLPPYQGGGSMIAGVTFEKTAYKPPPHRFEAGTGNIADAVGLGAAIDYLNDIGMDGVHAYEDRLLAYGTEALSRIPGVSLIGSAPQKAAILSFIVQGAAPEDVGKALDDRGIAVRAGHHCAQPILRRFGLESTVRASLAFYNTQGELDALASAVTEIADCRA